MIHNTDVVIIGAGPVGLFSIFECGMLRLRCHIIDALDMVGGQCSALYPEKPIYDIPAHPQISGADLVKNLHHQAEPFNPVYHLGQKVVEIKELCSEGKGWEVVTSAKQVIRSKVIVIAAGVGAFGPNRPPLKGIEDFEGKGVHYYVKSREQFRNKKVVIAGGGDSAIDWALSLAEIAARVTVVHRRSKFRAAPESEARLHQLAQSGKIDLVVPYQLHELEGDKGKLNAVVVQTLEGATKSIPADDLLAFFGLSMNLGPIADWGLGLDRNHITVDPSTSSTSRPGIYAVGDISTYPNKLKLILTGFAESAQAAHSIRSFLYPEEVIHFEYSTTKGIPIEEKFAA